MKKLTYQWEELRYKFLSFLCRKIAKNPPGTIRPRWVQFIYYILFPIKSMYERQANVKYDMLRDSYTINGIEITRHFLKVLDGLAEERRTVKITKNYWGFIQFEIVDNINIFSDERGRK
jgi:hypothetical protein